MSPKISVIIPIFGTEEYLDKCIKSVINQTFKEIEIICVDDCSPDDSYKIVEEHIKKDGRISLIRHEKNLGLGGARNTAIRVAKAEYIASVDSDDYMSSKMLETLWDATEHGWFDIVCCGYSRVDEKGNILSNVQYDKKQVSNDDNSIDIFSTINPAFWNKLWRKSLFVDNDIFFPEHDYYEDMSTTPRILAKSSYVKVIKNCLYRYLIRKQSIMNEMSDKHIIDYLKGFEIISRFLEENDLSEHYRKEFYRYIRGNIIFYSKSILNSGLLLDKKTQYLRFLILFRITFTENFRKFNNFDISKLLFSLGEEELHGTFFDKHQQDLHKIDAKEDYITRQKNEIKTKTEELDNRANTIHALREELDKTDADVQNNKNNLMEAKNDLKMSLNLLDEKEEYIGRQSVEIKTKTKELEVRAKAIRQLREEGNATKRELNNTINRKQRRINLLEEEGMAENVSLFQMFAIIIFAVLTLVVMTKKQRSKLINKPRIFFRDSKNGFAKKYASLFNIL